MEVMMTYVQPFFDWLLQTTLIGSVVICLILAAQKTLGGKLGPRWCHALWLVLLIRMVLPWSPSSPISLFNLIPSWDRQAQLQQLPETSEQRKTSRLAQPSGTTKAIPVHKPQPDTTIQKQTTPKPRTPADMKSKSKAHLVSLRGVLALLWLAGATVIGAYLLMSNFALWGIVKRESPLVNQEMLELFEKCKVQMGVQTLVAVVPSDQIGSPALFGFIRPRLLLPREMLDKASYEEMRYVFLHELAHLKRRDIYVGWLTSFLQVLHWFNPLVWFAFYRMRTDRELACDALVLTRTQKEESQEYGRAIVGILRRCSRSRPLPAMAGILENRSQLKRRISMIARFKKNSYQWSPLAVILIILLACVSLPDARGTKASGTSAAPPEPEPAPRTPVVVERRVAAGYDDAEEHVLEGGTMEGLGSTDLEFGYEGGTSLQTVGIRLLNIQIPKGATITSAWVQFSADDVDNDHHSRDVSVIIEGEASPNPATFGPYAGDISSRLVTTASVVWDIPRWMQVHLKGPDERTPDISAIIQEIVEQPDWAPGNALVLLFRDNPDNPSQGTREAESFDGDAAEAALLHIEYVVRRAPTPPVEPPVELPVEPPVEPNVPVEPAIPGVIERRVAAGYDDAEEHVLEGGKMEGLGSGDLELVYEGGTSLQMVGIRLLNIQIPKGARITSAWVQFSADDVDNDYHSRDVSVIIEGEASPHPPTFGPYAGDISSRPTTTAKVVWGIPRWMEVHLKGPDERTPDISAIIQEIVEQPDWAPGNALVLLFRDNPDRPSQGTREAESFDGEPTEAPLLHIEYVVRRAAPPAGANIIWVTATRDYDLDGVQDDQGFIDWLVAEGHTVDVRIDYWKELDAAKADELNAADLVIISRSVDSRDHCDGDEPTLWNSVTTPLILMNGYLVRSSRWRWMDTTTMVMGDDIMLALDPTHPLFEGVTLEGGNMVIFRDNTVAPGITSFVACIDAGNGTLIARALSGGYAWIAEWPAGVEFYAGSGQIAGDPRMLFVAGTQEEGPTPQGAWDLSAEGEKIFRNAIAYMLPAAPEPPAGYLYDGDVALYTPEGPGSLDGTWDHNNGSDQWDGTGPGEGNPGGAVALTEDGVTFLRIQDTGDPRDYGMPDPSNRKVYLTHLIDGGLDGATLEVRIRIATSAPLDDQHPDNRASVEPWPVGGIGYHIRDDGKGMFGISAGHGNGIISFSLAKADEPDFPDATSDLLVMNNLAGTEPAGSAVDTGDPGAVAANTMDIADATQWNTISISIAAGGAGTHVVTVSVNGGAAQSFDVTAGTGTEANGSCITIGSSGTRGVTAFDLDYISVQ